MTFNNTFGDMTVHRVIVLVIAVLLALLAVRVIGGGRKKIVYVLCTLAVLRQFSGRQSLILSLNMNYPSVRLRISTKERLLKWSRAETRG